MDNLAFTDHELLVSGDLTFANVAEIRRRGEKLMHDRASVIINLRGVRVCDSAAIALLLAWVRWSMHEKKTLFFKEIPRQLQHIAQVCGVATMLPIDNN